MDSRGSSDDDRRTDRVLELQAKQHPSKARSSRQLLPVTCWGQASKLELRSGEMTQCKAIQSCCPGFHPRTPGRKRLTPECFLASTHACTCTQASNLKLAQWLVDSSFHSAQSYHSCKFKLGLESSQSDVLPLFFEFSITWHEDSSSERLPSILCGCTDLT